MNYCNSFTCLVLRMRLAVGYKQNEMKKLLYFDNNNIKTDIH